MAGLVSVVIPCFNAARYVGRAIESALEQTYDRIEVIVIDDGSTDGSLEIIRSYDSRIVSQTKTNGGACAARNDGVALAHGEFIQFLDADDFLMLDSVSNRIAAFTEDVGLVFGDRVHVDEADHVLSDYESFHPQREWESTGWIRYALVTNIHTMEPLHRAGYVRQVGGFDESFPQSQEPDFHLRLLIAGCRFKYAPGTVGAFRQHASTGRISATPWWSTDPERFIDITRYWLSLVSATNDVGMESEYRHAAAIILCYHAIQEASYGNAKLARRYHDEVLRFDPDYLPEGLSGRATSMVGLWSAIRIAGWLRRLGLGA
ncbi:MAG: glycosyltransferase [Coriobacteriia bacterium]